MHIRNQPRLSHPQRRLVRALIARVCTPASLQTFQLRMGREDMDMLTRPEAIPFLRAHLLAPTNNEQRTTNVMSALSPSTEIEPYREVALRLLGVAAARGSQVALGALRARARNYGPLQLAAHESLNALPYFTSMLRNRYGMRNLHFALALADRLLLRLHGIARRDGIGPHLQAAAYAMQYGVFAAYKLIDNYIWRPLASESERELCNDFHPNVIDHTMAHVTAFVDFSADDAARYPHFFHSAQHSEVQAWLIHTLEGPLLQASRDGVRVVMPWIDKKIPASVPHRELALALRELAYNAIKYRDRTKPNPTIWIGCGEAMEFLRVRDNGIGIADLARIGEYGFRERRAEGVEGTGIGLASARKRLADVGWRMEVESVVNEGATFTLRPIE